MVLLRHLLGDALRRLRLRQGRTLREVSAAARVSLGYLSEVERGQKEASSELLAAICSALGAPLSQVFREVSDNFALAELQSEPVLAGAREPALDAPAAVGHPAVGMDAPAEASAFSGGELGDEVGAVLDAVRLRPGQAAAFDDEAARRIRDVTDMVSV
jgi:transcriptional regulator with XRE-family HTH domain